MKEGAILVLAAGAGSRFGSCKQLAELHGKPLLQHAIDSANAVLPGHVYSVVGSRAQQIQAAVSGAQWLPHAHWQQGIGSSIAAGVAALSRDYDWLLLTLGDQPGVSAEYLQTLIDNRHRAGCICSRYCEAAAGQAAEQVVLGVPALFQRPWYERLTALGGDKGARALLGDSADVYAMELSTALDDVDTPADLARHAAVQSD